MRFGPLAPYKTCHVRDNIQELVSWARAMATPRGTMETSSFDHPSRNLCVAVSHLDSEPVDVNCRFIQLDNTGDDPYIFLEQLLEEVPAVFPVFCAALMAGCRTVRFSSLDKRTDTPYLSELLPQDCLVTPESSRHAKLACFEQAARGLYDAA